MTRIEYQIMNMNARSANAQATMRQLAGALCRHPVDVRMDEGIDVLTFVVEPQAEDYGRIIGGRAENLKALKVVAQALASRIDYEQSDLIVPPQNAAPAPGTKFAMNPNWSSDALEDLAMQVGAELFDGQIRIDWRKLTTDNSRLSMVVDRLPSNPGYPAFHEIAGSFGRILGGIALSQGHRVKFELATVE